MTGRDEMTQNILEIIPDILLWIDNSGYLLDYHPNNHAFLFDREEVVIGHHLEDIFNHEVSSQMLNLASQSREKNGMQSGQIIYQNNGSVSLFECRIAPVDEHRLIAGWRELDTISGSRNGDLIKGNCEATLSLLTESNLDTAIQQSFITLGKTYQADRIILFRNKVDSETSEATMTLEHEWSHRDVTSSIANLQLRQMPYYPAFSALYETLNKNQPVIAITEDLYPDAQRFLNQMEIKSFVIIPVFVRNKFWGFLGIGDCQLNRIWMEEEVVAIKSIAIMLGAVIQQHQDQEELIIARLQAEESDRLKSSILANMNHEFRTPMTGILGFSDILSSELPDDNFRQMARNIYLSGKRLLSTLNSMIELAQFEAKKALFKLRETKLNELILVTCERFILSAKQKGLGFDIRMNESVFSYVDEKLCTQLLDHILENAVKFTNEGTITVETFNRSEAGKTWSCISIKDTGPGIPEEFHEVIFEEFRQVSEGYNRSFEGSGLGLTLAKKIVELMNGKLTLYSHSGTGCMFTIWLPSSQIRTPETKPQLKEFTFPEEVADFPLPGSNRNLPSILIVEDNRLNCELILIYLRDSCNCDVANDGETAIKMARAKTYDTILMDINLGPGIDGIETTRQIRKLSGFSETPIIAVTGYTMESDIEQILSAGCSHYLPKPIEKNKLSSLINSLITKQ
ncbi:MAG: ATP-binding protein [Bacteroidota bacterium]